MNNRMHSDDFQNKISIKKRAARTPIYKTRKFGDFSVLLLLVIFAVCILLILLTGSDTYQRLYARDDRAFDQRTAAQYLSTKIRQSDRHGCITAGTFGGCPTIELNETIDGEKYLTRLYCYKGYLRELFASADADLHPEDGETVLQADSLTVSCSADGRTLFLTLTDYGGTQTDLVLSLRSGTEVIS